MAKIRYYPNAILSDPELPFDLKISRSMTVYVAKGNGPMIKADSIYLKRQNKIVVSHKGWRITISGYNKTEEKFIYKIEKEEKSES
jgi:hypothetical protein